MYGTEPVTSSPNLTLVHRVHTRSQPALKVLGKVPRVRERPADPEQPGRVSARLDALLEGLVPVLGAPNVGSAQPKQLIGGVVEAGKALLLAVPLDPALCKIETENLRWCVNMSPFYLMKAASKRLSNRSTIRIHDSIR